MRRLLRRREAGEAADPVRLARRAGIKPDPWQAALLRSEARQMALLCSRQSGKSTVTALLALHTALYRAASLILLLSPSLRQSKELFRKITDAMRQLDSLPVAVAQESALQMELGNGSRIIALPGDEQTVRGFSGVSLLVVDEAARVPDSLYQAIRPMLAVSGGRIVLLSTPFGRRGFFYSEWGEGGEDWERVKITAHDCPRISPAWLEQERQAIGDWWFAQEYLCEFKDATDQVFASEFIDAAFDTNVPPLWRQL